MPRGYGDELGVRVDLEDSNHALVIWVVVDHEVRVLKKLRLYLVSVCLYVGAGFYEEFHDFQTAGLCSLDDR